MSGTTRLEEFLHGASRLPVLPQVTVKLLKALDSEDSSARDVARIVETEPALAARMLKLANSSFYGQRGAIAQIDKAVTVLGAKTIRSLALTVWTHTLRTHGRTPDETAMLAPLLAHGLAAGVIARQLLERIRPQLAEDGFMAGLLHDIGRVALVGQMGMDYQMQILNPALAQAGALHTHEQAALGFDHRQLGAALMLNWTLPAFLATCAEQHHDPLPTPEANPLLAAVALADAYATRLGFNLAPKLTRDARDELAPLFRLGSDEAISEFLDACLSGFRTMSEVLDKR